MGIEHAYSALRVVLLVTYTVATVLLTRSQILAYVADYSPRLDRSGRWRVWRWRMRKRPGANGRSTVDLWAILFSLGFAGLGILACGTALRRLLVIGPYPLTADSLMVTAFVAYMAVVAMVLWRFARRERLNYGKQTHHTDVQ